MLSLLQNHNWLRRALLCALFFIIIILLYYPTMASLPFWDDWYFIFKSWTLKNVSPLEYWKWGDHRRSWPVFYSLMSILYKSWGTKFVYYHLLSAILQVLNSLLIYKVLKEFNSPYRLWLALIYMVHPVHFFTVTWIIQIKTLFAIAFFLLAVLFFLKRDNKINYILSILFFALSLLAKSIFSPLILLMPFSKMRKAFTPFVIIGLYSICLTLWNTHLKSPQSPQASNQYRYFFQKKNLNPISFVSIKTRPAPRIEEKFENPLAKISVSIANLSKYIVFSFYPWKTLLIQPMTTLNDTYSDMAIHFVILLLFSTIVLYFYSVQDWIFVLSAFSFFLLLAPLCGGIFIPIFHYSNFVDYWLSAPLLAVILCISRVKNTKIMTPILIVFAIFLSVKTFNLSREMPSAETMITTSIKASPDNPLIQMILAKQYFYEGKYVESNSMFLRIKKNYSLEREKIDKEIDLNLKRLNGDFVDDQTL